MSFYCLTDIKRLFVCLFTVKYDKILSEQV